MQQIMRTNRQRGRVAERTDMKIETRLDRNLNKITDYYNRLRDKRMDAQIQTVRFYCPWLELLYKEDRKICKHTDRQKHNSKESDGKQDRNK